MGICDGCIRCPKNYYEKKALSDSVSPYEKELENENTYREQYSILSSESRISNDIEELQLKQKYLVQKNEKSPYEIYNLVKTKGEGSFGKAQLITLKSNPNIQKVLKVLPKKYLNKNLKNISSEIEILRRLDHPYILSIYEFFEDESNFYFVNDYFPDGDLASQFEKNGIFTELSVKYILYQLLQAVTYLHENNVMHGDIKLENILIENINYCDSMEDCSNMPINIESNPPARIETLCANALAAKRFRLLGYYFQRARIVSYTVTTCLALFHWTTIRHILKLFKMNSEVTRYI